MSNYKISSKKILVAGFALLGITLSLQTHAALLNLPDTPIQVTNNVIPNIFFDVDDSGSMDWEIMSTPHWHFCAYDPNATGSYSNDTTCGWEVTDGLVRSYQNRYRGMTYMYRNNDNAYSDDCSSTSRNSFEVCTTAASKEWRAFSSDLNSIYYNPTTTYEPWKGPCVGNNICANANFDNARSNPKSGESGYNNLKNLQDNYYHVWIDDKGYTGNRPLRAASVNATNLPNNKVDLWDSHVKITLSSGNVRVYSISYNPTAGGLNRNETLRATLNDNSACYNVLGPKSLVQSIYAGNMSYTSTGANGCRTIAQAKQNFANWYQYDRRRSFIAKSAISNVVNDNPNYRYGLTVINRYDELFIQVPSASTSNFTTHNRNLLSSLYSYNQRAYGTPLRRGLERAGLYFDDRLSGKEDPIIHACQQNFTVLLTDGFWNGSSPSVGNSDGDPYSRSVADVADYYYKRDLSSLPNIVNPTTSDPATHQHMVTFTLAFGVNGNLQDTDNNGWPNPPLQSNSNWGDPFSNTLAKIDDLWHAAYNSKGQFFSAKTPEQLSSQFSSAIQNIGNRVTTATAISKNSTVLKTGSAIYQARFDSHDWSGELLSYGISTSGIVNTTPTWNAQCKLSGGACSDPVIPASANPGIAPQNRVIITPRWSNSGPDAIAFNWPKNYTTYRVNGQDIQQFTGLLKNAPYNVDTTNPSKIAANNAYGDALIKFLRGDYTQEAANGGSYTFRDRNNKRLGDIVSSSPHFVAPPSRLYPENLEASSYISFKNNIRIKNRPKMIFTGANDGMVHGFNANTGAEIIAFVPEHRKIYAKLADLANQNYTHRYYIDGHINSADAYVSNRWRTVLAGGYGNGGQGVYALDITHRNNSWFSESNARRLFLWEFDDEDDADLGYTHSDIIIARVNTSAGPKWAAIFGNGYNNTENDGHASTTGKAALFILIIERGLNGQWRPNIDYFKIPVGPANINTPNGLSSPFPVDSDGDYIVDYVYAGDINGNMWKFDLTGNQGQWVNATTKLFAASNVSAGDQPITTAPVVGAHPRGKAQGFMVYFGTGKLLEFGDNSRSNQATQAFYGIWDKNNGQTVSKSNLLRQHILGEVLNYYDTNGDGTPDRPIEGRWSTDFSINWDAPSGNGGPAQHHGWYMDLKIQSSSNNRGERALAQALLRNERVIFTTYMPPASACGLGGDGWLMEISRENGGYLSQPPFDFNLDAKFDVLDYLTINNGQQRIASGMKSPVGAIMTPAVMVTDGGNEVKVFAGSGGMSSVVENPGTQPTGRQNWRQIK